MNEVLVVVMADGAKLFSRDQDIIDAYKRSPDFYLPMARGFKAWDEEGREQTVYPKYAARAWIAEGLDVGLQRIEERVA